MQRTGELRGSSLAELRINVISDETWMNAAKRGLRKPMAARATPTLSTSSVPTKFCMIVRRQRRAMRTVSTSLTRLFPISTISALSRATSVPEPMATPTEACIRAGASFTPSPTMATVCESF